MRRLVWITVALAAACGEAAKPEAGPLDRMYLPTGLAVYGGRLLVVSSNSDLRYDSDTGGSVIPFDPSELDTIRIGHGVNIRSFGGDIAIGDPVLCTSLAGPLAVVATRGSNTLNVLRIGADGLSCAGCGIPLSARAVDPLAVTVACGNGRERAFVAYLRAASGEAWISEYDLADGALRNALVGAGPIRGFAYDREHDRLYMTGLATSSPTPLRWIDLAGCEIDRPASSGGCTVGQATMPGFASGLELRSIALAHPFVAPLLGTRAPQRAFITGRLYDATAAATAGGRTTDYSGVLLVVDLVESAFGGVDVQLVNKRYIGHGAQDVRVLPTRGATRRDVVAALTVDEGELWIYDDDTGSIARFGRLGTTGVPELGSEPYGLAVDPVTLASVARVYVGSFSGSFVTPIDVPLDAPGLAGFPGGTQRKITGGVP